MDNHTVCRWKKSVINGLFCFVFKHKHDLGFDNIISKTIFRFASTNPTLFYHQIVDTSNKDLSVVLTIIYLELGQINAFSLIV